jgi:hypothetical protein
LIGSHVEKSMANGTATQAVLTLSTGGKERFAAARDAVVTVELRNAGNTALWVNGRMLLNTEYAPDPYRDLWLDIQRVDEGARVDFNCKVRAGPAPDKYYRVLKPAEAITVHIALLRCFDIRKPGTYRVQAYYRDGREDPPGGPSGVAHLSAQLTSQPLTLAVEG